jgi:NhaP-type Na+/H+ or K+/H+ antiporter
MEAGFLPDALAFSRLMLLGILLLAALIAGEAVRRYAKCPRITGYVIVGALLGPEGFGFIDGDALFEMRLLVDLAIGLVVYDLGRRLDAGWLRRNKWLVTGALAESAFCFCAIYAALAMFGFSSLLSAIAAAIGTATSPAVVILVSADLRSEGQITERLILFTAVNTVIAYLLLALLFPFLHLEHHGDLANAILHPIYVFAGAAAAGAVSSWVLLRLARWVGKREDRQFVLQIAVVIITIGVAHSLKLSVPVALVTLGLLSRNFDARHAVIAVPYGHGGQIFFLILFVLTGASLEFHAFGVAAMGAVGAYILARFLGKAGAVLLFGKASGIPRGGAGLLAIALLPLSGQAVVMVRDTVFLYPSFGKELGAVVLSAVVVLELIGPLATEFALRRAGEARPEPARA